MENGVWGEGVGHCVQSHHKTGKACMGFGFGKKRTELIKIEMEDYLYDLVSVEFCLQILPKGSWSGVLAQ